MHITFVHPQAAAPRCATFLVILTLATSCTELDTSGADRCTTHSDCNPGRVCEDNRCRDVSEPSAGRDGSKPIETAGTGSQAEMSGAAGRRSDMDAGMDSAVKRHDTGAAGSQPEPDTGTAGSGGSTADDSGSEAAVPSPDGGGDDTDADIVVDPDVDGGEPELPFREAHACGQRVRNFDSVALWLSAGYDVRVDDQLRVVRWKDQSIHGHRAVPEGEPTHWPLLTTSAEIGRPGVQFGPVMIGEALGARRLRIADHPALQFSGDFAIIAVLRYRNPLALTPMLTGAIYLKLCLDCTDIRGVGIFANDSWGLFTDGSPSRSGFTLQIGFYSDTFARTPQVGFNDNAMHIVVARRLGGLLSVAADRRVNAGVTEVGYLDVSTAGWDAVIGANPGGADQILDGELFELIAVAGPDAYDVDMLVDCLATSYAIPEL